MSPPIAARGLTRRSLLAGGIGAIAAPALAAVPSDPLYDTVIVGAGAAGIAAARALSAAKLRIAVIEAAGHVGGRCVTDTRAFGIPFDRGANWINAWDVNPLAQLATRAGFELAPARRGQRLRIGRRVARESESEEFLAALVRAQRGLATTAGPTGKIDVSGAQALPADLGEWRDTVMQLMGPLTIGRDLASISATDLSRLIPREPRAVCAAGYGTALARLADGLPVRLDTPATRIEWSQRRGVDIVTSRGNLRARAAIVTVPAAVLRADGLRFDPDLPDRVTQALARLETAHYERIALEITGEPFGLRRDDTVVEKTDTARTAAMVVNVGGTALSYVDIGGSVARDLAARGQAEMTAFARDWLVSLYGADIRAAIGRTAATRWTADPWIRGAWSTAAPGGAAARGALREPLRERIFFAGEATHETAWGSVEGAWEAGERAAKDVLGALGFAKEPRPSKTSRKRAPARRRSRQRGGQP